MQHPLFTISAVERDVGLSKDVLRVWERRYGFPSPGRDANGERLYPGEQVQRLRLIKRLMDQGYRPGRLLATPPDELEALAQGSREALGPAPAGCFKALEELLALVRSHDASAFRQALQQRLAQGGLRIFVQDTVGPLAVLVGLAWEEGRLQVFEEHLFTEVATGVLRQAIAAVPGGHEPRVLLTTLPNEPHGLGLLMVEAVLALEGARCISLGTQMPVLEIAQAAQAHRADVVALSFSTAFPARQILARLDQLRAALAPASQLWVGGAGVRKLAGIAGVLPLGTLDEAVAAVAAWRGEAAP
jgi:DNA-binding transcriptional MerR regulator/methylmalonyl-CoA mutase cobalamin-binding subunit